MTEITITIDESGDLKMLETAMAEPFKILGTAVTKRASHVEPYDFWPRVAFTVLRKLVSDDSRIADWTRRWGCFWRVNTKPVGGPILRNQYGNIAAWWIREDAIAAEIEFLNKFFGGISEQV